MSEPENYVIPASTVSAVLELLVELPLKHSLNAYNLIQQTARPLDAFLKNNETPEE